MEYSDIATLPPQDATAFMATLKRLDKDTKQAGLTLSDDEARFLVDSYYIMQEQRKRSNNQLRALAESGEPNELMDWFAKQSEVLEKQVAVCLDVYSYNNPLGFWSRQIVGVGPVIAAGLLAHIDFDRAPTAGSIWRFAGLDPTCKWLKGQKRPWNASLKTLCWKLGESFVYQQSRDNAYYGQIYAERKKLEEHRNEAGMFAEQAARTLEEKKFKKDTVARKAYESGKLPQAHIHARAKRYAVKIFLSHFHHAGFVLLKKRLPPAPYVIAHLEHVHYIPPPVPLPELNHGP